MSTDNEPHPLRVFRDRAGLSQTDVARAAGLHVMTISGIERRVVVCGRRAVVALLDAFGPALAEAGISTEDLLRGHMAARSRKRKRTGGSSVPGRPA